MAGTNIRGIMICARASIGALCHHSFPIYARAVHRGTPIFRARLHPKPEDLNRAKGASPKKTHAYPEGLSSYLELARCVGFF